MVWVNLSKLIIGIVSWSHACDCKGVFSSSVNKDCRECFFLGGMPSGLMSNMDDIRPFVAFSLSHSDMRHDVCRWSVQHCVIPPLHRCVHMCSAHVCTEDITPIQIHVPLTRLQDVQNIQPGNSLKINCSLCFCQQNKMIQLTATLPTNNSTIIIRIWIFSNLFSMI